MGINLWLLARAMCLVSSSRQSGFAAVLRDLIKMRGDSFCVMQYALAAAHAASVRDWAVPEIKTLLPLHYAGCDEEPYTIVLFRGNN